MTLPYKCTFGLKEGKSTSVTQKQMPRQREQYGSTVHLFICTSRSPCKITSRPFAFDNNSILIYRGLDSLFLFKSVSFFLPTCRSSLAHNFGSVPSFVLLVFLHTTILTQVRRVHVWRYLFIYYTPKTLSNHVFRTFGSRKPPTMPLSGTVLSTASGVDRSRGCDELGERREGINDWACFYPDDLRVENCIVKDRFLII
jgi:hypothetical protein